MSVPVAAEIDKEDNEDLQTALTTGGSKGVGFVWSDQVDETQLAGEPPEGKQQEGEDVSDAHRLKNILRTNPTEGFDKLQEALQIQPSTGQERLAMQRAVVQQVDGAINELPTEALDWSKEKEDEQRELVPGTAATSSEGQASGSNAVPGGTV